MTHEDKFSFELLEKAPIIAIIRGLESHVIHRIAETLLSAGLFTLEVTMNTHGVCEIISSLRENFPEMNLGAGTVLSVEDLDKAADAGAQFIVTPVVNEAVIREAKKLYLPVFPGALTPTEIHTAWSLGASAVKVFPATQFGAAYMKEVSAPLDTIKLVPTGGISIENVKSFFEAGAYAVGVGNTLMDPELIAKEDWQGLKAFCIKFRESI